MRQPFPGETCCLTLLWAVLDLYITNATNRTKFAQLDRQRLKRMRYECIDLPELLRSGTASGTRTRAADETKKRWASIEKKSLRNC